MTLPLALAVAFTVANLLIWLKTRALLRRVSRLHRWTGWRLKRMQAWQNVARLDAEVERYATGVPTVSDADFAELERKVMGDDPNQPRKMRGSM